MAIKDTIKKWLNIDPTLGYTGDKMYNPGVVGWDSLSGSYHVYKNDYENAYASIRVLAGRFASIEPYTVDKTGKSVSSNVLDRLYTPNNQMSAYDFREALAIMSLIHNKVYLRTHWNNDIKRVDTLTGFTFLEGVTEHIIDGDLQYWLPNGEHLTTDDVIVLKSINPYRLADGFSNAFAARRWTQLDDYIADYQAGFFRNGAVPAGQFVITAKTATEFADIANKIKRTHQGVGKNNNVMFVHRPMDATGKPVDAQVQWIPFSTDNKDMALKELFEQANKKIDSVYGVPASLRGVNDTNTYASVRVDTQIFYENTLMPFTYKIWGKLTHELNRITGGLGVAITYDIEIPQVADEEKVKAEARQLQANTITSLASQFDLPSIAKYMESGLVTDLVERPKEKEEPEVLDSTEAKDTPDQPIDPTVRSKSISARDYSDIYNDIDIDPDDLGCIMVDTESLEVQSLLSDDMKAQLFEQTKFDQSSTPAENVPHITLLYGLLENGNIWKDKVDELLKGWKMKNATIEKVDYFKTSDSYAVIGHIEKTPELVDGHERLTLLPHIQTFSEYKPHITLAYVDLSGDVDEFVEVLGKAYNGKNIKTKSINYGDKPDEKTSSKELSPAQRETYEQQLSEAVRERMKAQIAKVDVELVKDISEQDPIDEEEDELMTAAMLTVLIASVNIVGSIERENHIELLLSFGIDASSTEPFRMTAAQTTAYREYVKSIATSYNAQTADRIRNVLTSAREQGLSSSDIRKQLRGLLDEEYRVERLARTEVQLAGNEASVKSMENLARELNVQVYKIWTVNSSDPCQYCQSMNGKRVLVSGNFFDKGDTITGVDGGVMTNDWKDADTAQAHANCACSQQYEVVRG